jgi:TPP-dependent pyruvate/acetoin dehydrogenase alpha subunit
MLQICLDHGLFCLSTQLPNAVGAAYSLKMDKKDACAVTYFGDGGTSEGDFHAALNIAAVMEAPVLFICRNNGWAISTPTSDQFRSNSFSFSLDVHTLYLVFFKTFGFANAFANTMANR